MIHVKPGMPRSREVLSLNFFLHRKPSYYPLSIAKTANVILLVSGLCCPLETARFRELEYLAGTALVGLKHAECE